MKLDKGPLTRASSPEGIQACGCGWLISLWTGFTLVAYFTPIDELLARYLSASPVGSCSGPSFYAGFCYMQAGFLREQVCKYMCPYARFQGVMFDPDTLVISYDPERGEPRGAAQEGCGLQGNARSVIVWIAVCVSRFVQPVSISARVCSTNASVVVPVSMPAIRSWTRSASRVA
jgi:hypothetical protein